MRNSLDFSFSPFLLFCCLSAGLSSFTSGFNFGSLNIPENIIRFCERNDSSILPTCLNIENQLLWGFIVSSYALGGFFGGLYAAKACNRLGRLKALTFNNLFYLVGSIFLIFTTEPIQFIIGRLLVGIGSGGSAVLLSTYLAELSTRKFRGFIGYILQVMLVLGILFSQILGVLFSTPQLWRLILAFSALTPLIQLILLPFCLETPAYLISIEKYDKAKENLQRLRSGYCIQEEYELILKYSQTKTKLSFNKIWSKLKIRKLLLLTILLHMTQQFCGINAILMYSKTILQDSFGNENANYITLGTSLVLLIGSMSSSLLVDYIGRKTLLIMGMSVQIISFILITIGLIYKINTLTAIFIFTFVFFFALGIGSVPWMIMSDFFPSSIIGIATSISVALNWLSNFSVDFLVPTLLSQLKNYTFILFTGIILFSLVIILIYMPETKGKTLDQVYGKSYLADENLD